MMLQLRLKAAAGTHPGQVRGSNQDAVLAFVRPPEKGNALGLLIVADGMGGHQAGEIASLLVVETIYNALRESLAQDESGSAPPEEPGATTDAPQQPRPRDLEEHLRRAVEQANAAVYRYAQQHPEAAGDLGSTVTCAFVRGHQAIIANVGDSRTYHLSEDGLEQVTDDHSYVGELVRAGQLSTEDIYDHPQRSMITRALGQNPQVEVDVTRRVLAPGDRLLLCSDGLWEMVHGTDRLAQYLRETARPDIAAQRLLQAANEEGGKDNIGVVVGELIAV
jgi:serine/threonine protein phosphatase PrpC